MANEVTMMPTKVLGGVLLPLRQLAGLPAASARSCSTYIRDQQIKDVVFVTGDIHTFIAGDVRTQRRRRRHRGASSSSAARSRRRASARPTSTRAAAPSSRATTSNPNTPPALIDALRGINPWVDNADFDHHGYGRVVATQSSLDCEFVRLKTIKTKSRAKLSSHGFHYRVARGQTSIKGTAV